jgi:hypothetical protein
MLRSCSAHEYGSALARPVIVVDPRRSGLVIVVKRMNAPNGRNKHPQKFSEN